SCNNDRGNMGGSPNNLAANSTIATHKTKVNWLEWSNSAFKKAREEDKPILLDISAVWCHWCHVMDETTYGDEDVAKLINTHFIPIRIDTDKRPDINDRYNMGGWPTTAFLTPEGKIIAGATYVPPEQMTDILDKVRNGYSSSKQVILDEIAKRDKNIETIRSGSASKKTVLSRDIMEKTVDSVVGSYDSFYGGFGGAPKFPMINSLNLLLQNYYETKSDTTKSIIIKTLTAMSTRGMYDSIDGGFFRYSTNESWTVPHFEKMSEDNAGFIKLYLEAYQLTGEKLFKDKAVETIKYVLSSLANKDRFIFYGSQDADENYYIKSVDERRRLAPPYTDKTAYTNWDCMMSSSFLKAAAILAEEDRELSNRIETFALENISFLIHNAFDRENGMMHYHDGEKAYAPYLLRDQVWMIKIELDAYEYTGERPYLEYAEELTDLMLKNFWSESENGLMDTIQTNSTKSNGELAVHKKNLSENALAAECLIRLYHITGEKYYKNRAEAILSGFPDYSNNYSHFTSEYAEA
ncbi:MAG: hypothetical protein A2W23_01100, partial [Planctomycetes bacterium RBG_16_43_13]